MCQGVKGLRGNVALAVVLITLLAVPNAMGAAETLGPIPEACTGENYEFGNCLVATRLGALSVSPHVVHAGGTITGTVALTGKYKVSWPSAIPFLIQEGSCENTPTCKWKVPANAPTVKYTTLTASVLNSQGVGVSRDYYAIIGKDRFELAGHIKDSEGKPVAGVKIEITGTERAGAVTDATGQYNVLLKRGSYTVAPRGKKGQFFDPARRRRPSTRTGRSTSSCGRTSMKSRSPPNRTRCRRPGRRLRGSRSATATRRANRSKAKRSTSCRRCSSASRR